MTPATQNEHGTCQRGDSQTTGHHRNVAAFGRKPQTSSFLFFIHRRSADRRYNKAFDAISDSGILRLIARISGPSAPEMALFFDILMRLQG
jgi:hypothetical protein